MKKNRYIWLSFRQPIWYTLKLFSQIRLLELATMEYLSLFNLFHFFILYIGSSWVAWVVGKGLQITAITSQIWYLLLLSREASDKNMWNNNGMPWEKRKLHPSLLESINNYWELQCSTHAVAASDRNASRERAVGRSENLEVGSIICCPWCWDSVNFSAKILGAMIPEAPPVPTFLRGSWRTKNVHFWRDSLLDRGSSQAVVPP